MALGFRYSRAELDMCHAKSEVALPDKERVQRATGPNWIGQNSSLSSARFSLVPTSAFNRGPTLVEAL